MKIEIPKKRRDQDKGKLKISGGKIFNIKNMNVDVPLGKLVTDHRSFRFRKIFFYL